MGGARHRADELNPASAGRAEADEPALFGQELRRLRVRAGLTQERLAERAGVSVATISALEEGLRMRPFPNTLGALADALDLTPAERTAFVERVAGRERPRQTAVFREPRADAMDALGGAGHRRGLECAARLAG